MKATIFLLVLAVVASTVGLWRGDTDVMREYATRAWILAAILEAAYYLKKK